MKWLFVLIGILSICMLVLGKTEKKNATSIVPPKKATYVKPTKGPKSLVDRFRSLPVDDIAFIKELDKQFATYGGNVKIKIAKVNTTRGGGKNVKRTINGDIGYGYQMGASSDNGYYFSKPKFQVYPYSQHDIPPVNNNHQPIYRSVAQQKFRPQPNRYQPASLQHSSQMSSYQNTHYLPQAQSVRHTAVELVPSQSFELKQAQNGHYQLFSPAGHQDDRQQITAGYYEQPQRQSMNYHQQPETVPVIVLRIPGPQKYAAHLQALLQEYLEIRAAEYIKTLQEHDQQQLQQQQQQQQQHQQHYHRQEEVASTGQQQQYYSQNAAVHSATEPSRNHHDSIVGYQQPTRKDAVDHHSTNEHAQQHLSYNLVPPQPESHGQDQDEHIEYQYVTIDQSDAEPAQPEQQHQQPQEQSHYVYGPPKQSVHHGGAAQLPVHENYPSSQHTQVYFPSVHRGQADHQQSSVDEDSIHSQAFHVAAPMYVQEPRHQYEAHDDEQTDTTHADEPNVQYYHQEQEQTEEAGEQQHGYNAASEDNVVTITQRPPAPSAYPQQPYNYHAHQAAAHRPVVEPSAYVAGPAPHSMSKGAKRQAVPLSNQQQYQQKISKLFTGLKMKAASSKEVIDSDEAASDFQITVVRRH